MLCVNAAVKMKHLVLRCMSSDSVLMVNAAATCSEAGIYAMHAKLTKAACEEDPCTSLPSAVVQGTESQLDLACLQR